MKLRLMQLVTTCVAVAAAVTPNAAAAAQPEAVEGGGAITMPVWTPLGVGGQPVNVVVQLAADPVAVHQANAGRKLARTEKDQIKGQLKASQEALRASIQGLGGVVLGNYQAAYNGIKVRVARNKAEQLASLPGVVAVHPLFPIKPNNERGVALIGAPAVWQNLGFHGEGVKVAIIDTGIDYTHANFGGPGTVAAYDAAHAAEAAAADPSLFGPGAPRVKGGIDLVGDTYNADNTDPATYQPVPHPDSNPLDCAGHGSHVAGTVGGSGVTAAGTTYAGPYNASTISGNSWTIGPGVAPRADLYSVRVFGCTGSTDVTIDAIEWAVDNDMDVINMSLGSSFGSKDDPSAIASTNAAKAGVVVVIAAGNEGANQYIVGSPGSAEGALTVAASDPTPSFPGGSFGLTSGAPIAVQNSNKATFADGSSWPIAVLRTSYPNGPVGLGCSQAEYAAYPGFPASLQGKMIVTTRNVCSRVARAIFAQQNGAAAAAMIDNTTGYPPFEGPITTSAETGDFTVTIPFFGVRGLPTGTTSDGARLRLADGTLVTVNNAALPNPNFLGIASFSSSGPRTGDSALKPDITAPGVSIVSTAVGTGNGAATFSGTSMATPNVAGVAALTRQAHPSWDVAQINAAIVNTGDPAMVAGYRISRGGAGLVQPAKSTASQVVAQIDGKPFGVALNYGLEEMKHDFQGQKTIVLTNTGKKTAAFAVSVVNTSGAPHSLVPSRTTISVPAHGHAQLDVTLKVPVATAGASNGPGLSFQEVAGIVQLAPLTEGSNAGVTLRVPYYLVPRALSDLDTRLANHLRGINPTTVATVTNRHGAISGDADFYAWGLHDQKVAGRVSNDVRAVGTQSFDWDGTQQLLVFAVNSYDRWSNACTNEFDISVDVDGDGTDDYTVVGVDQGAVNTGSFSGRMGVFVFSTRSPGSTLNFLATAPTDSATALLPVLTSQLCRAGEPCLSATNPRITYHAAAFDLINGGIKQVAGTARYNVWASAISQGGFASVAPGASDSSINVSLDSTEWALTPAQGLMVVTLDNKGGKDEAQLIRVSPTGDGDGDDDDRDHD